MTESSHPAPTGRSVSNDDPTPWQRLPATEPIRIRDPLAELLGMVPEGEPLSVMFAEVAKAAGHACPAVAGAYRCTQLALSALHPETLPVRSEIAVTVGGDPDDPGLGPMANVVRHVTGAADETGFDGFGGYGGRSGLMTFGEVSGSGRAFEFVRTDTDEAVRVAFDPSAAGVEPDGDDGPPVDAIPRLVSGEAAADERAAFLDGWHSRVQRLLRAEPGAESPVTVERV